MNCPGFSIHSITTDEESVEWKFLQSARRPGTTEASSNSTNARCTWTRSEEIRRVTIVGLEPASQARGRRKWQAEKIR